MKFWSKGKQLDTATMTSREKVVLLAEVERDLAEAHAAIGEFCVAEDLRAFAVSHFGRDADPEVYVDRSLVADRLEGKLEDLSSSDRVKALGELGLAPLGVWE